MIELLWPWALAVLPLPLLVIFALPRARLDETALRVPFYADASNLKGKVISSQTRTRIRRLILLLAWTALVLAASQPQWIGEPIALPASGRDLMLAVDISGSMDEKDMLLNNRPATRLALVKQVIGEFVERRRGDRLGLILFGTQAYLQVPLTFDRNTVRTLLNETPIAIAGQSTAIGDAIGLTVKRLRERPENSRVLILLTDGVNNAGEMKPEQAAELAARESIRIYTIGVGADQQVVRGLLFNQVRNPSNLDEKNLNAIAAITGGKYYRARDQNELEQIYRELDQLEPVEQAEETYRPIKALYVWPLSVAFLLSLGLAFFSQAVRIKVSVLFNNVLPGPRPRPAGKS